MSEKALKYDFLIGMLLAVVGLIFGYLVLPFEYQDSMLAAHIKVFTIVSPASLVVLAFAGYRILFFLLFRKTLGMKLVGATYYSKKENKPASFLSLVGYELIILFFLYLLFLAAQDFNFTTCCGMGSGFLELLIIVGIPVLIVSQVIKNKKITIG